MAGALCLSTKASPPPLSLISASPQPPHPPISFFYGYFHNTIREELNQLYRVVTSLELLDCAQQEEKLQHIRERYHFLSKVYIYHSSVEDEVVYPALEAKVKNVTCAYTVEHEDEERLLEQLGAQISATLECSGEEQQRRVTKLVCKVEEVHVSLTRHLAKEEEQLLPLLLHHFSEAEQAELVAQFLLCIPLAMVDRVLEWLIPNVPPAELSHLCCHIAEVVSDQDLLQLLQSWLQRPWPNHSTGASPRSSSGTDERSMECCSSDASKESGSSSNRAATAGAEEQVSTGAAADEVPGLLCSTCEDVCANCKPMLRHPPLSCIAHIHRGILGCLRMFLKEAQSLQDEATNGAAISGQQLAALAERHRFLRSVCLFHSLSEDEVVFPAAKQLAAAALPPAVGGAAPSPARCDEARLRHGEGSGCCCDASTAASSPVGQGCLEAEAAEPCEAAPEMTLAESLAQSVESCCVSCQDDHQAEVEQLEKLGRMLADVRASARRGVRKASALLGELCASAQAVLASLTKHMQMEEREVLPLLQQRLDNFSQAKVLWRTLWVMPLRLLERVLPWLAEQMGEEEAQAMLCSIRQGASGQRRPLVGLLCRWARRGAASRECGDSGRRCGGPGSPDATSTRWEVVGGMDQDDLSSFTNETCEPRFVKMCMHASAAGAADAHAGCGGAAERSVSCGEGDRAAKRPRLADGIATASSSGAAEAAKAPVASADGGSPRSSSGWDACGGASLDGSLGTRLAARSRALAVQGRGSQRAASDGAVDSSCLLPGGEVNPIDHIFQFHKALRREVQHFVNDVETLDRVARELPSSWSAVVIQVQARFRFLRGVYEAHSRAEDEVVFPALESKQALRNVTHAYELDHQQESELFDSLALLMESLDTTQSADRPDLALRLLRISAAVRATMETHVRSEEEELWPLFAEHFTREEQQRLVGTIIGRTGAEVLQALLPWVTASFTAEEEEAMMESMREATKKTSFEHWLDAVSSSRTGSQRAAASAGKPEAAPGGPRALSLPYGSALEDLAQYLSPPGTEAAAAAPNAAAAEGSSAAAAATAPAAAGAAASVEASGVVAEASDFCPGWEHIFRMNQKELEAAVRRVSNDSALEPSRKAYLIQNVMVSKWIVASQMRMGGASPSAASQQQQPQAAAALMPSAASPAGEKLAAAGRQPEHAQQAATSCCHYHDRQAGVLGCKHYRRAALLIAPCCGAEHVCRLCHDEAHPDHELDRYAVKEMRCMYCSTRQPIASHCSSCGKKLARYYCDICHLFDDTEGRDIYHCPFCNVCRRGKGLGIDFFHCMECNACMSLSLFNKHRCREKSLEDHCPICHESLFESSEPIKELPCSHFMHSHCFAQYTQHNYTCPICSVSMGDMSMYWQMLDSLVAADQATLPPQFRGRTQDILCRDCSRAGTAPFHFVYHRCPHCRSYNTRIL